jgi:hypothetical protein
MKRRQKVALAVGFFAVVVGGTFWALRPGQVQSTEKLVRASGAENLADVLRYGNQCGSWEDYLLLSMHGGTALWESQNTRLADRLALHLRRGESGRAARVIRDLYWGPSPTNADIEYLLKLVETQKSPLRTDLLGNIACSYRSTPADKARVEAVLRPQVSSSRWEERKEYAFVLTFSRCPEALPYLRKLLDDPHEQVRAQAIYALGFSRDSSLKPRFLAYLDDPSDHIRKAAWRYQWIYSFPGKRERLLRGVRSTRAEERRECTGALTGDENKADIPVFRRLLSDPDLQVQRLAALALGRLHDTASFPLLRTWLRTPDPYQRRMGMTALWWGNDRKSLPEFKRLLSDPLCREFARFVVDQWEPKKRTLPDMEIHKLAPWLLGQGF